MSHNRSIRMCVYDDKLVHEVHAMPDDHLCAGSVLSYAASARSATAVSVSLLIHKNS